MHSSPQSSRPERILVVIPNWVGDVVLATPTLAALRAHFAAARIAFLLRGYVADVVAGGGWHDELLLWPTRRGVVPGGATLRFAAELRRRRFDLALLLTNSFRAALVVRLARIPRRVGYAREGRGWLLTDRLRPLKHHGEFVPSSVLPYYAALAEHVGCPVNERLPVLHCTDADEQAATELRRRYALDDGRPYAIINPGAAFGAAKCWLPERFAEVCDRLSHERGLKCVLVGAPRELPLLRQIRDLAKSPVILCDQPGTTLGSLKPLIRDAALLVCNDTGPRHYGNAFAVPTVTIFGPTDPAWTDSDYGGEVQLQARVECSPCQLPTCPLDHRCMRAVTADHAMQAVGDLLDRAPATAP